MSLFFTDIETVPEVQHFEQLSENKQRLFAHKFTNEINQGLFVQDLWKEKAGLFAEFGKVVCISIGIISGDKLRVKSLCSRFEEKLLKEASELMMKATKLCGHNLIDFDAPFLIRRMIINKIELPTVLSIQGKKPWELPYEDTMKMWGEPAWGYKASLALIAECLGLPNPKDEMSGSSVSQTYWGMFEGIEGDQLPFDKETEALNKISTYCQKDVITTANVYQRMKYRPIFEESQIEYV